MGAARRGSITDTVGLPVCIAAAAVAFALLFSGVGFGFWWQMAATGAGLCALAFLFDPPGMRGVVLMPRRRALEAVVFGIMTAALLYGIFYVGNAVAGEVAGFARTQVARVYDFKQGAPAWRIVALLVLVIGPAEEVFWRGFVQRRLVGLWGMRGLALSVAAYGLVHVASGNLMLVVAALVCGAFWGLLYLRFRSIWLNIVSHVVWDVAVFVLFPIGAGG